MNIDKTTFIFENIHELITTLDSKGVSTYYDMVKFLKNTKELSDESLNKVLYTHFNDVRGKKNFKDCAEGVYSSAQSLADYIKYVNPICLHAYVTYHRNKETGIYLGQMTLFTMFNIRTSTIVHKIQQWIDKGILTIEDLTEIVVTKKL